MELKQRPEHKHEVKEMRLNRTYMELKQTH